MKIESCAIVTLIEGRGVKVLVMPIVLTVHESLGNIVSIDLETVLAEKQAGQSCRVEYLRDGILRHYFSTGEAFMGKAIMME